MTDAAREIVRYVESECGVLSREHCDLLESRITAALERARKERDWAWWEACALVDNVPPTPEGVKWWHAALEDLAFKQGREQGLEEAAKVADGCVTGKEFWLADVTAWSIALAIRALKRTPREYGRRTS